MPDPHTTETSDADPGPLIPRVWRKARARGPGWFWQRLKRELSVPETETGKKLAVVTRGAVRIADPFHRLARGLLGTARFSSDSVHLFYDLEVSPITYDFCWALALADLERRRRGLGKVHVVLVPGTEEGLRKETPDYEAKVDRLARRWRIDHMVAPLCQLLPSFSGLTICASRAEARALRRLMCHTIVPKDYLVEMPVAHKTADGMEAARRGEDLRVLRAPETARRYVRQWLEPRLKGRRLLTITLREYDFMTARNSNKEAWAAFAGGLDPDDYLVAVVPDVEQAMEPQEGMFPPGVEIFDPACWNLHLRSALYEAAFLNLAVNTGPFVLCWMNERTNYLMFKVMVDNVPQTTREAMESHGFEIGETPVFAGPGQKWVWHDDTRDCIEAEFTRMEKALKAAGKA